MTRQNINIGSSANDGTGDTLRSAGTKINANFQEIYTQLGGNSSTLSELVKLKDSGTIGTIQFEGTSADSHETKLIAINPTADRTISLPNATGTIILQDTTDTLTNKTLTTPTINSPIIGTAINDANGNEIIKITANSNAVNEITIANGASITGPTISATGSGTNLNLRLASKGTGSVSLSKASFTSATITANGAANSAVTYIIGNKASPLAVSLADGTTVGEYKIFTNKGAGVMTVTPSNFSQGTTFALAQNDGCTCIWDGSNWSLIGNQGEVTVA